MDPYIGIIPQIFFLLKGSLVFPIVNPASHIVILLCLERLCNQLYCSRRPYCIENAGSHLNSTAKRCKARSVLGWGTARELQGVDSFIPIQCAFPDSQVVVASRTKVYLQFPIVNSVAVTLKHRSEPQQIVRQSLLSCLQHLDAS